ERPQTVQGVNDVVSAERYSVAPLDPRTELDRKLLEVGAVLVTRRQPEIFLVAKCAEKRQRLVDQIRAGLMVRSERLCIPEVPGLVLTLVASLRQDKRPVPRYVLELSRSRGGRSSRRGRCRGHGRCRRGGGCSRLCGRGCRGRRGRGCRGRCSSCGWCSRCGR